MPIIDPILDKFITQNLESGTSQSSRIFADDPTIMGFSLIFYYDQSSPLLNPEVNNQAESAERYLKQLGEEKKLENLKNFVSQLKLLTDEFPYYYQNLKGLENIYDFKPERSFDDERELTIETLESIDMRVASLIQYYYDAVYENKYRRHVLPENLKYFKVTVVVNEIRNFRTFVRKVSTTNEGDEDIDDLFKDIDENHLTSFVFDFEDCTFNFTKSNPFLDDISNSSNSEGVKNQFSIKCGKMVNKTVIRLLDLVKNDNLKTKVENPKVVAKKKFRKILKQEIKNQAKKSLEKSKENMQQFLKNEILAKGLKYKNQLLNGNVIFRSEAISPERFLTGNQSLLDLNPLKGRLGDYDKLTAEIILSASNMDSRGNAVRTLDSYFKIPNFQNNPIKAVLDFSTMNVTKSLLGFGK